MTQSAAIPPIPIEQPPELADEQNRAGASTDLLATPAEGEGSGQPEPLTPERVTEWNRYYDLYLMLAVLLLAFVVSAMRVNKSSFWSDLRVGELIAEQGSPVISDPFSYSEAGKPWVNIPWLFQWANAMVFKLVGSLVPVDAGDPGASRGSAEQNGVRSLIVVSALCRVLAALVLMRIRRAGPGLWWTATCVALALGAFYGPLGLMMGGIAGPGEVAPSSWGLLLLSLEMLVMHLAYNEGRGLLLFALAPLFLLWVNIDESFLIGLLIVVAAASGRILDGRRTTAQFHRPLAAGPSVGNAEAEKAQASISPAGTITVLLSLSLCAAACLANPQVYRIFPAVLRPVFSLFGPASDTLTFDELSYFGNGIRTLARDGWYRLTLHYLLVVAAGLASFFLNARRFTWNRFLPFVLVAACWGAFIKFGAEFAVVFATALALNGQEWYLDRFGLEGRPGSLWRLWSTGGRLLSLAAIFGVVSLAIAGWRMTAEEPRFGFSYAPDDFAFEAAEYLATRGDIAGNVLNTTLAQGDALIWKAYPTRKTFLDSRDYFFSRQVREEYQRLRGALRRDDSAIWRPVLDKYGITAVIVDSSAATHAYRRLMQSPDWIPFYDDGQVIMLGRADAQEPDLTVFKSNRLEPDHLAYSVARPVPSADRPPTRTSWVDELLTDRLLARPQPHTNSARRWLQGSELKEGLQSTPDPARCLLAVREARTALAKNPDDWLAYRLLNVAYRVLIQQESALLAGIPLTRENAAKINELSPSLQVLNTRFRQRATALNYAIQTTPPDRTADARQELESLNLQLFQLFLQAGYLDLARDRLQALLDQSDSGDFPPGQRTQFQQHVEELTQRVRQIEDKMMDLQVERQAGPVEKAAFARSQGAPGLAIAELEEAGRNATSPALVKPQLVDLYCNSGQPDKALELLTPSFTEDPNFGSEPGMSYMRQGAVYLLLGNYRSAASLWQDRAIPRIRYDRSIKALSAAVSVGRGELIPALNTDQMLPSLVNRQALWEYELGLCLLESGSPEQAAGSFTRALKLFPDHKFRPIIAYYLGKLGKPVPELPPKAKAAVPNARGEHGGSQPLGREPGGNSRRAAPSP